MSLNEEDRKVVVRLEMEKSYRVLAQADKEYNDEVWDLAANRYYYACYHAVQALFVHNSITSHRHASLLRYFGQFFIKPEIINKEFGPFLNKLEQLREKSDYNVLAVIGKDEVDMMVLPAHNLIKAIEELLKASPAY